MRSAGVPSNTMAAAVVARAGAQVDDPVGVGHHGLVGLASPFVSPKLSVRMKAAPHYP
jgi:hypothetical protein